MAALAGPDKAMARSRLAIAARHGNLAAEYHLGVLLHDGVGGPQDLVGARRLFAQAAAGGRADAAYALRVMADAGAGGPTDVDLARKSYEQTLAGHIPAAMRKLVVFEEADYVPPLHGSSPAWHENEKLMRGNITTLHTLRAQIVDGPRRFVLAVQCETQGISAVSGVRLALWLLSSKPPAPQLFQVKYRREGARSNAGAPPFDQRYRPGR